jgi:hypothetical protein
VTKRCKGGRRFLGIETGLVAVREEECSGTSTSTAFLLLLRAAEIDLVAERYESNDGCSCELDGDSLV